MDKVYIDPDTADSIVVASLRDSINYIKIDIKRLKSKKKLEGFEKEDLADFILNLDAMEKVFDYYGGSIK